MLVYEGAPFWTMSVLFWLDKKGIASVTRSRPAMYHPLFSPVAGLFAAFDFARKPFSKTSQMFFVLGGNDVEIFIHGASSTLRPGTPILRYSNWIAAALVTLFAIYLHALFFLSAGGLWRDEAELVHLSLLPSLPEVWQNLPHDSCPILMPLVVRAWSAAGLGNTDLGLRVLGLVIGLFLLLAFWFASWTMRNGAPLLAVTLAGLNVTMSAGEIRFALTV